MAFNWIHNNIRSDKKKHKRNSHCYLSGDFPIKNIANLSFCRKYSIFRKILKGLTIYKKENIHFSGIFGKYM